MDTTTYVIYDENSKGRHLPLYGLLFGMLFWFLDALVDVHVLQVPQTLLENLVYPSLFEAVLRTAIILLMVALGISARGKIRQQEALQRELLDYKNRLEELIELSAEEVRDPTDSVNTEITVLKDRTRDLEDIATRDGLTQLYNRRKFNDALELELARANRYHHPISLILADIDRYSEIVSMHGTAISEHVIRSVVSNLRRQTRATDILARWAEDEFAILAVETGQADASILATKLMQMMDDTLIDNFGLINISCGVTEGRIEDTADELTGRAVEALRLAREQGGNGIAIL